MSGPLDALELLLEGAVEGTALRLFRPRLEPALLTRAAIRQMERAQLIGPDGPVVPNVFRFSLHPLDARRFEPLGSGLERQLADALSDHLAARRWRTLGPIRVSLAADPAVPRGRPRLAVELQAEPSARTEAPTGPGQTTALPRARLNDPAASARAARLIGEDGRCFELRHPVTSIGRALENDIVVDDSRVSRFHAELHREGQGFRAVDLGSTNGTRLARDQGGRLVLRDGDVLLLGGYCLVFHQD
jgi:FHA domain-containing protein